MALLVLSHPAGSPTIAGIVSLLAFFFVLRLTVIDVSDLELIIGTAVRDCLRAARITEEQAAPIMGMDVAALRRCLRGEGRLQLGVARLMRLGLTFWTFFTPILLYQAARLHCEQVRDDAVDAAKAILGRRV